MVRSRMRGVSFFFDDAAASSVLAVCYIHTFKVFEASIPERRAPIAPNLVLLIISGRHLHTLRGVQSVVCTVMDRVQGGTTALYLGLQ